LDAADAALGFSLSSLMFKGPAEELTLTHNAQPALLAHSAAVCAALRDIFGERVRATAGHSLGEFTAYHAAGSLSLQDALGLVRKRGELMYEAGLKRTGAMAAVVGDLKEPIESICARATAEAGLVVPANYNSPLQIVISGEKSGVERAMVLAKEAGARRAVLLNVSGAFHSPLMDTAIDGLKQAIAATTFKDPSVPVFANVNSESVTGGDRARQLLLEQLTRPVLWTSEVMALAARFPNALYVEVGPSHVLTGLVHRTAPTLKTMPCGTVAELNQLLQLAA
jgi:[acyl-carrier-protein] S-malonyltransferase